MTAYLIDNFKIMEISLKIFSEKSSKSVLVQNTFSFFFPSERIRYIGIKMSVKQKSMIAILQ